MTQTRIVSLAEKKHFCRHFEQILDLTAEAHAVVAGSGAPVVAHCVCQLAEL